MAGLGWTLDELVQFVEQTASCPQGLNPLVKQLLSTCPGSSIFGIGGHSVVLWINQDIAAKTALEKGDERLRHEQEIFKLFPTQSESPCPYIARCWFQGVDVTFLEVVGNGTLHHRISIKKHGPIFQWMLQLSCAAAYVEALGYAHGDINPQNILLDGEDRIKLIDFDHSLKIGDMLDVGYEPYVRQHRAVVGGLFGVAGPVTEQFALGSVFWYMTRGSELYSELEGPERVDRLLDGILPTTTNPQDPVDGIIQNCWSGKYPRIADLVDDIRGTLGVELEAQQTIPRDKQDERRRLCEKYYNMVNKPSSPALGSTKEGDGP